MNLHPPQTNLPPFFRLLSLCSKAFLTSLTASYHCHLRLCYVRELVSIQDLKGRVSINFIISGTGSIQMATVKSSTVGNAKVENCIAHVVRGMTFPQPKGGDVVIVLSAFLLQPVQ